MHVSRKFQRENEGRIAGCVRAMLRGWKDAIARPAEAIDALIAADRLIERDNEIERLDWVIRNQIVNDHTRAVGLGSIDGARLGRAIDQVAGAMQLPRKPTVAEMWTDRYLPPLAERRI
jgi:NitT/TauT family transport system substrate-binding protein